MTGTQAEALKHASGVLCDVLSRLDLLMMATEAMMPPHSEALKVGISSLNDDIHVALNAIGAAVKETTA